MVTPNPDKKATVTTTETNIIVPPESTPPFRPRKLFSVFSLLIALVALLLAGFTLYSLIALQKEKTAQEVELKNLIENVKEQQITAQTEMDSTTKRINESQNSLEQKMQGDLNRFNARLENIIQQSQFKEQDWLLLQARYYLELAQANAQWGNNFDTTIALLKQADNTLSNLNEQRVFPIRQAIAKEITQVESTAPIDLPGILSQLDAAEDSILSLPLKRPAFTAPASSEAKPIDANASKWRIQWNKSLEVLNKLVVIRRNNDSYQPLLGPQEETLARTLLQLNLQEAQWAVLQLNNEIYQFTLQQALKNIKQVFDTNDKKTQDLLTKIQALQKIHLANPQVLLDQSLPLLNSLIDQRQSPTQEKS